MPYQQQNSNRSVGALWNKTAKGSGKQYMSGKIELEGKVFYFAVFPNERKKLDKHPDYQMVLSERTAEGSQNGSAAYQNPTTQTRYTPTSNVSTPPMDNTVDEIQVEDIPF